MKKYLPSSSGVAGILFIVLVSACYYGSPVPNGWPLQSFFNGFQPLGGAVAMFCYCTVATAVAVFLFMTLTVVGINYDIWRRK